ncbi:hypothetical protein BMG49_22815 [Salmonella enterica]|nr:hypothetical protein [Salmonella enterica]EBU7432731.1 hypothetical protein [Salmonella enterica subsp. enterica serovar Kottbus]ECZ0090170.1 hypothetical protein [Salmonella enterica subsp. enterica serovar Miami]EDD8590269.1 hypothetical protein [Salmonella enterica subsp. enterica serovar Abony]EDH4062189.1 hypothetical protein [Salmonella enterica subsp. enterica serovar Goldcoast]EDV5247511.1 hypothetical protein [Salmonella enterica subsp. enterica]EDV6085205.1 hypothetical protein [
MTPEIKQRLSILIIFSARILARSLRDVPFVLMVIVFAFLLFAPESTWTVINQIWHHLRPLTDREAVMLGKNISNILQLAWIIAAFSRFMLSVDEISSRMREVKDGR